MTATIVLLIIAALIALSAGLLFVLPWAVRRRSWMSRVENGLAGTRPQLPNMTNRDAR